MSEVTDPDDGPQPGARRRRRRSIILERTSNFVADADWDRNPAAEWTTDPALMGATQNMDDDEDDIWTNYFQMEPQTLDGGRTLHLDLRSDHDANAMELGVDLTIARGPASTGDAWPSSESIGTRSRASKSPWAVKSTSTK